MGQESQEMKLWDCDDRRKSTTFSLQEMGQESQEMKLWDCDDMRPPHSLYKK